MPEKTAYMIMLCGAAAIGLSGCGSTPEDTAARDRSVPGNVATTAATSPTPVEAPGDAAIAAKTDLPGNPSPLVDDNIAKSVKPAEPIKDAPPAPTKLSAVKMSQPVATLPPVIEKTAVAVGRPASFGQCAVCHSDKQGQKSGFGPNLFGIAGTTAGAVPGYAFSDAMASSGVQWNRENLDAFLLSPQSTIPGTKMAFSGVKDPVKRKEIVDYILGLK